MELEKLTPEQFERFQSFIYRHSGIKVDMSKITMVSNRIRRRLRAGSFPDFNAYYRHLTSRKGLPELEDFLDTVTTNETSFFRTPSHFQWFKEDYLKELLIQKNRGFREPTLRVWSAACSTGEEPYSIAICAAENSLSLRDWNVKVLGTDISEKVLRMAREGVYPKRALEELDSTRLKRHFDQGPRPDTWKVRDKVRQMVEFKKHNLMQLLKLPPFDCIFVRNVLIYFDHNSKATVIGHLIRSLVSGGYLCVGPSEGIYDMLDPLVKRTPFLYQKP